MDDTADNRVPKLWSLMCSVHLYSPYLCSWKTLCKTFAIKREMMTWKLGFFNKDVFGLPWVTHSHWYLNGTTSEQQHEYLGNPVLEEESSHTIIDLTSFFLSSRPSLWSEEALQWLISFLYIFGNLILASRCSCVDLGDVLWCKVMTLASAFYYVLWQQWTHLVSPWTWRSGSAPLLLRTWASDCDVTSTHQCSDFIKTQNIRKTLSQQ